jgi:hypothetical protein
MKVSKRETTQTKIDLARDALGDFSIESKRPHIPIYRKLRFKGNHGPIKGMDTVPISNKRLCGELGRLCQMLRERNIPYPWREGDHVSD